MSCGKLIICTTILAALAMCSSASAADWVQARKLLASDGAASQRFGISVDIDGNIVIIGTRNTGSAYLFDATSGEELFKLTADDAESGDDFGFSDAGAGIGLVHFQRRFGQFADSLAAGYHQPDTGIVDIKTGNLPCHGQSPSYE